jgi:hypothetical protein
MHIICASGWEADTTRGACESHRSPETVTDAPIAPGAVDR